MGEQGKILFSLFSFRLLKPVPAELVFLVWTIETPRESVLSYPEIRSGHNFFYQMGLWEHSLPSPLQEGSVL